MNSLLNQKTKPQAGFTLLEIAVSLAVIGFAIVAVIGVLPTGLNIQKDTREKTVILQDASYFMEAIRHGASEVVTNRAVYESTQLVDSIPKMWRVYEGDLPEILEQGKDYRTDAEVIQLLSEPSRVVPKGRFLYSVALVRALSGPASEKGGRAFDNRIAFSYFLRSEILPVTNSISISSHVTTDPLALGPAEYDLRSTEWNRISTNLSEMRFAVMWPPVPDIYDAGESYRNKLRFRTMVSGAVGPIERLDATGNRITTIQPRRFQ